MRYRAREGSVPVDYEKLTSRMGADRITKTRIAGEMGVPVQTVIAWFQRKTRLSPERIAEIERITGMEPGSLIAQEEPPTLKITMSGKTVGSAAVYKAVEAMLGMTSGEQRAVADLIVWASKVSKASRTHINTADNEEDDGK